MINFIYNLLSNERFLFWGMFSLLSIVFFGSYFFTKSKKNSNNANLVSFLSIQFVLLLIIIQMSFLFRDIVINHSKINLTEDIGFIASMLGLLSILLVNRTNLVTKPIESIESIESYENKIAMLNQVILSLQEDNRLKNKVINNCERKLINIKDYINNVEPYKERL